MDEQNNLPNNENQIVRPDLIVQDCDHEAYWKVYCTFYIPAVCPIILDKAKNDGTGYR